MTNQLFEILESRTLLSGADYDYISDLTPFAATNGHGPIERDRSNGERARNDGEKITMNGAAYRKGLGVHASSEMHFKIAGNYRSFISDVGVDDEVGEAGSVIFQVFADGQKLFDSGVLYGWSASKRVNVDVSGSNELVLIVKDAGDGFAADHGDWGGARLVRPSGEAPTVSPLADVDLDEARGFLSLTGTFSDSATGPWSGTVDFGDNTPRQRVVLGSDGTFELGHWYPTERDADYTATVRVSNGNAVGVEKFNVHMENQAPTRVGLVGIADEHGTFTAMAGLTLGVGGTFSDLSAFGKQNYTVRIDYGDGSAATAFTTQSRLFDVQHLYRKTGTYKLTMSVTDAGGERGVGVHNIIVKSPHYTYLSDLIATRGSSAFRADHNFGGGVMRLAGNAYQKGLGVAADSTLSFAIGTNYQSLIADVGIDDATDAAGSLRFQAFGDGNLLFDSGEMSAGSHKKRMNVNVTYIGEVTLVVTGHATLHGNWAGIRLLSPAA